MPIFTHISQDSREIKLLSADNGTTLSFYADILDKKKHT